MHVGAKISGLTPNTTYLVRIVAFNEQGTARGGEGEKKNFTTAVGGIAPTVTKVKPKKGSSKGGNAVTIEGTSFENVTAVYFGSTKAATEHVEVTKIVAIAPPGVGKVDITVWTEQGTSPITNKDVYEYGKPTITSLSPNEGSKDGGTEVIVTGSGFELGNHGTKFVFGKVDATSVECTASTTCVVVSPPEPEKKGKPVTNVQAEVNGGKSNKGAYKYTG